MGAGISKERERSLKYRALKKVESQLNKAGIPSKYVDQEVRPIDGLKFSVYFGSTLRASNGEAFGNMVVNIFDDKGNRLEQYSLLDASKGVERVIILFGPNVDPVKRAESDADAFRVKVDHEFRKADRRRNVPMEGGKWHARGDEKAGIFLYDDKGVIFAKNEGQVYAYPESQNGKVYVRLGTSGFDYRNPESGDYVEVKAGYTIRDEKGTILLTR